MLTVFKTYISKNYLMNKICITGANGFICRNLYYTLSNLNRSVVGTVRSKKKFFNFSDENFIEVININDNTDWSKVLTNCTHLVHCAGLAHVQDNSIKKKFR